MNKHFFSVLVVVLFTTSQAWAQFSFGVRTGLHRYETRTGSKNSQNFNDKINGFQVGAVTNYNVNDRFFIEQEILFVKAGVAKKEDLQIDSSTGLPINRTYVENPDKYVKIPIRVLYKTGNKLILQAGVYFGYEFGGKFEEEATVNGTKQITTYKSPKEFIENSRFPNDTYKEFDWGLGAGIARQFGNNIQIGIDFSRRVNSPKQAYLIPCRVGSFSLTATYMFGKNKNLARF